MPGGLSQTASSSRPHDGQDPQGTHQGDHHPVAGIKAFHRSTCFKDCPGRFMAEQNGQVATPATILIGDITMANR